MKMSWLKKLFNRKKVSLATMDATTIYIPDLKELSEENKETVLALLKDIDTTNYKSTVKYSEDLAKRTEKYLAILYKVVSELNEAFDRLKHLEEFVDTNKEGIPYANKFDNTQEAIAGTIEEIDLLSSEAELLKIEIGKSDIIATLKTIAFKEFIKRENKKKYRSFTELFKAEKMKEAADIRQLLCEYERLTNSINIIRSNLYSATMISKIADYSPLIEKMSKYMDPYVNSGSWGKLYRELNKLNYSFGINMLDEPNYTFHVSWSRDEYKGGQSWIQGQYKGRNYNKAIEDLARYKFELDKCIYDHRFDYKYIIERIKKACLRYRGKGSWRWDMDQLEKDKTTLDKTIFDYFNACDKFVNEGIKRELMDAWGELYCYYHGASFHYYSKPDYFFYSKEKDRLMNERFGKMLDELVSRGVPLKKKNNSWEDLILSLNVSGTAHFIYDVYYDDINPHDTVVHGVETNYGHYGSDKPQDADKFEDDAMYYKLRKLIYENSAFKASCNFVKTISIEDLYYVMRNIGMDDEYINYDLFSNRYNSWYGIYPKAKELLIKSQINKYKAQYDDRIMIMPHKFSVSGNEEKFYLRHHLTKGKNLQAIFVSDWFQLYCMWPNIKKYNLVKYLFVRKSQLKYSLEHIDGITDWDKETLERIFEEWGIKIIPVPDDIRYSDLSGLLDNELELANKSDNIILEQKLS